MSPVFLFDVGVIVFVVRSGGSELDRPFAFEEEVSQMPIDTFGALIAIKAKQLKGEKVFNILDLFLDLNFTFAVNGALFGPTGGNTDRVKGVDKITGH